MYMLCVRAYVPYAELRWLALQHSGVSTVRAPIRTIPPYGGKFSDLQSSYIRKPLTKGVRVGALSDNHALIAESLYVIPIFPTPPVYHCSHTRIWFSCPAFWLTLSFRHKRWHKDVLILGSNVPISMLDKMRLDIPGEVYKSQEPFWVEVNGGVVVPNFEQ